VTNNHKIIEIRRLPGNAYVLKCERNDLVFKAGQHIQLAPINNYNMREYSIYSDIHIDCLEVLIKVVENGYLSKKLNLAKPGDYIQIYGPIGYFTLSEENQQKPLLFIASGTGISPFHSIIGSFPNINYTLIHGVKYGYEAYEREFYDPNKYILCTSQDKNGNFAGRLTQYLTENVFDLNSEIYLCGNNSMIMDAVNILIQKGFSRSQMHTEVYF
jgi:ferredoxin--NADP+ reductase